MSTKGEERPRKSGHKNSGVFKNTGLGSITPSDFNEARRTLGVLEARGAIGAESPEEAIAILRKDKSARELYNSILDKHGIVHS